MKKTVLVSGLINLEVTLQIEGFPIAYQPVRYPFHGVNSTVSGVGFNVAKALHTLGDRVTFASLVGADAAGHLAREELAALGIASDRVLTVLNRTPHSVILYDPAGKRQINVDLKDIQQTGYPEATFRQALEGSDAAVLCNINFSRPFLRVARERGIPVATDVHAIADLDDSYNADFMREATILFMSDELLPCSPQDWARELWRKYQTPVIGIGMGGRGALLSVAKEDLMRVFPARSVRPIVSTIGAGDALFSSFLHGYLNTGDPVRSMEKAVVFAGYKIGEAGAAQGFLTAPALDEKAKEAKEAEGSERR
jgi:ribokinase